MFKSNVKSTLLPFARTQLYAVHIATDSLLWSKRRHSSISRSFIVHQLGSGLFSGQSSGLMKSAVSADNSATVSRAEMGIDHLLWPMTHDPWPLHYFHPAHGIGGSVTWWYWTTLSVLRANKIVDYDYGTNWVRGSFLTSTKNKYCTLLGIYFIIMGQR